jgi:hypothetical protein
MCFNNRRVDHYEVRIVVETLSQLCVFRLSINHNMVEDAVVEW